MEDWVLRGLARWPDVPALFGWLGLDRRGRWLIRGEPISRPQVIETINRNYAADEHGRWHFQNGPQRGYVTLAYTPLVLWVGDGGELVTHTGERVRQPQEAFLDEEGAILLLTEHGVGVLSDTDLDWALQRLESTEGAVDEARLASALSLPSGASTALSLRLGGIHLPLQRIDREAVPARFGYVREPAPRAGERAATQEDPA